jgi:TonB family protein
MMMKKKTSRLFGIKFVLALPALALLLFAFAEPSYEVKEVQNENLVSAVQKGEKEVTIHGQVIEEKTGEPLPGASIVIKGTSVGTVSDIDGTFILVDSNPKVDSGTGAMSTILVVSFVGKKTVENMIKVSGNEGEDTNFTFKMEDAVQVLYNKSYSYSAEQPIPPPPPPTVVKEIEEVMETQPADGEKEVFYIVEDFPKYPGGYGAMQDYIAKMQQKLVQGKGVKGKAKVAFTINAKGKVTDIKIVEKDNEGTGNGAYEIVKGMQDWTPGKQRGKAVPVKYLLPVEFNN